MRLPCPIGEILEGVGTEGLLLEAEHQAKYALLPLDDDLLDYLLERSPRFAEACQNIRGQMHAGHSRSHEEVRRLFNGA
jgi:hypothetical protein